MYFRKSEDIAKGHHSLAEIVEQIDQLIYEIGDHPIRPDRTADTLDIEQDLLERVLQLYVKAGTLQNETRRYCSKCETLIDDSDELARECDNCEAQLARTKPDAFSVFTPVDPVVRLDEDDETEEANAVRIQFVGGDRGGSHLADVQIPKEHKRIKAALKEVDRNSRFVLADPVFAATMSDLSKLYDGEPQLIHFSGHGNDRSLSFIQDQELLATNVALTIDRLRAVLDAYPYDVQVVIFNACNSATIAEGIAAAGVVDVAVGWEGKVTDSAAITFAELFYWHLGNGLSLRSSFILASQCAPPEGASFKAVIFSKAGIDLQSYRLQAE